MFKNIDITNFRGIKKSYIEDLRQVNLFFGKNNCGKSSLLESVFLISGLSNPLLPFNINSLRSYFHSSKSDLALDFYNLNLRENIRIAVKATPDRELTIASFRSQSQTVSLQEFASSNSNTPAESYGLKLSYRLGGDDHLYNSEIIFKEGFGANNQRINRDKRYQEHLFAKYLPSSYTQVTKTDGFAKIVENKQEKEIIAILQRIEPKIQDLQLVGEELMADIGLPQRLPINVMGDGIRKLLAIILAIYECKDGILLIDEVDNGLHYSAMPNLWTAILDTAKACNTQVFITTHSLDSLKGLAAVLREKGSDYQQMVSSFKLIKKDTDELIALKYDYAQFDYSINQEMEIR